MEGLDGREARYFVSEALDEDGPAGAQLMLNGAAQVADDLSPWKKVFLVGEKANTLDNNG